MALAHSPKIITDGLVLCLDAGNTKSYPGSGTTWTDLSGQGNNGTLVGTITHSSLFGGVFVLPGTTGNYISVPSPNLSSSNNTIMGASRYVNASGGGRIFSGNANNWLLGHHGAGSDTHGDYYANGWVNNPSNTGGSVWRIYTGTGDVGTDTWKVYENASLIVSNSNGSQGPNGFSIGIYGPGNSEYSNAYVSFLLAYNRVLSDDEIQQNFNALRGRFSI